MITKNYNLNFAGDITGATVLQNILSTYKNVHLKYIYIPQFLKNTPLQEFVVDEKFDKYALSNILSLAALWKYGGTYLDTDFFVTKPITLLSSNYAAKYEDHIKFSVLNLDFEGFGHELAEIMIK